MNDASTATARTMMALCYGACRISTEHDVDGCTLTCRRCQKVRGWPIEDLPVTERGPLFTGDVEPARESQQVPERHAVKAPHSGGPEAPLSASTAPVVLPGATTALHARIAELEADKARWDARQNRIDWRVSRAADVMAGRFDHEYDAERSRS